MGKFWMMSCALLSRWVRNSHADRMEAVKEQGAGIRLIFFKRPCEWHKRAGYRIGYVCLRCDTVTQVSVLAIFLHDLVRPGEENRRADERQVNQNLPLDMFGVFIRDVDERF